MFSKKTYRVARSSIYQSKAYSLNRLLHVVVIWLQDSFSRRIQSRYLCLAGSCTTGWTDMALYCTFNSRREASSTIGNTAKQRGIQLFERPWNFYEPDNTAWWLIPSTEWPAYRHGKFFFDEVEGHSDILLCVNYHLLWSTPHHILWPTRLNNYYHVVLMVVNTSFLRCGDSLSR